MCMTIILIAEDAERARAALSIALAQSALGSAVQLYAHERAVALFARKPRVDDDDATLAAAGLPDRLAMLTMAADTGVTLIACQTGMAMTELAIDDLVPGVEPGGLVSVLAQPQPHQLLTI
ncbi:MAG: peroxiredoxin [Sphingomonas sp.]|nr:peroxiredoxin [Sphingomonas sp.]